MQERILSFLLKYSAATKLASVLFMLIFVMTCASYMETSSESYVKAIFVLNLVFFIPIFLHFLFRASSEEKDDAYRRERDVSAFLWVLGTLLSMGQAALLQKAGVRFSDLKILDLPGTVENPILLAIIGLWLVDFLFFIYHWLSHVTALGWFFHSSHHSIESLKMENSIRIDLKDLSPFYWLFIVVPMGILGFEYAETYLLLMTSLNVQYFLHNGSDILKSSRLRFLLNIPALHRVHHGTGELHLDKNFAGVISTYDLLLGTFQDEGQRLEHGDFGLKGQKDSAGLSGAFAFRAVFVALLLKRPWLLLKSPAEAERIVAGLAGKK